jgi:carbonic anhydrase/acetyltransferase-like protein (isoleucine patch superfamily)
MAIHEVQPQVLAGSKILRPLYSSRIPILGNDVLRSWMDSVRKLGIQNLWLTSDSRDESTASAALVALARQGVERLLTIKLNAYAEMDLTDLLRFHCERRNSVTEAQDSRGRLGVNLLDRLALNATVRRESSGTPIAGAADPYQFRGYAKRTLSARERQELVRDALTGSCALRPLGTQIGEQLWIGEDVQLADSVRLIGPTYIGDRTIVRAGATVGPFASVERDCVVDCGTTVERSTVLPYSYLAPGLLILHKQVDGQYLVDLVGGEVGGEVADLRPAGLGSRIEPREMRRQEFSKPAKDVSVQTGGAPAWSFAPFSTATQPWLQVQL